MNGSQAKKYDLPWESFEKFVTATDGEQIVDQIVDKVNETDSLTKQSKQACVYCVAITMTMKTWHHILAGFIFLHLGKNSCRKKNSGFFRKLRYFSKTRVTQDA